jgi:hypothetical protein
MLTITPCGGGGENKLIQNNSDKLIQINLEALARSVFFKGQKRAL